MSVRKGEQKKSVDDYTLNKIQQWKQHNIPTTKPIKLIVESLIKKENREKSTKMAAKVRKNKQKVKKCLPKKYRIKRRRDKLIFIRIKVSTKN